MRPDVTLAQKIAVLVAGIPIISNLLAAFSVYTVTQAQQDALGNALTWGGVLAAALIGGDAALRAARNHADATIHAAAVGTGGQPPDTAHGEPGEPLVESPLPDPPDPATPDMTTDLLGP